MKQGSAFAIAAVLACTAIQAQAADVVGQRYIDQMLQGGPVSIRQAAQNIYHTGMRDQEVLDVAAELLAQNYGIASGNTEADAYAWVCKALGQSGNGRYQPLLAQVADSGNRKLSKHCGKAAKQLSPSGDAFAAGSVNLDKYRAGGSGAAKASSQAKAKPAAVPAGSGSFDNLVVGMSMEEVNALVGAPSATYSHQTGKAWNPFNFQGKDVARVVHLYKGKGRVTFSQDSVYSSVWRVMEVLPNPNESGYP